MTLREAIAAPTVAATVLGMVDRREPVPVAVPHPHGGASRRAGGRQ
jgi:Rrf2 family nitric oxide-sensitive transcriptional repressor